MSTKLFVGNLAFNITDRELSDAFAAHVPVVKAEVVRDKFDGRSRGFGFVELQNAEDVQRAIKVMTGCELLGRPIRVEEASGAGRRTGNAQPRESRRGY